MLTLEDRKKRRLFLEYEQELHFLEQFHEKLTSLNSQLTSAPTSENPSQEEDIHLAKQKVTHLLLEIETKIKFLFNRSHFEKHLHLIQVLQRRLKNKYMRKKLSQLLLAPEHAMARRRYQLQNEIISSEVAYSERLFTLCSQFLFPLQSPSEEIAKAGISEEDIQLIFRNISSLYLTSQTLLERIHTCNLELGSPPEKDLSLSAPSSSSSNSPPPTKISPSSTLSSFILSSSTSSSSNSSSTSSLPSSSSSSLASTSTPPPTPTPAPPTPFYPPRPLTLTKAQPQSPSKFPIGEILLSLRPSLLLYADYIINHEKAKERLSELRSNSPKAASVLRKLEQKAKLQHSAKGFSYTTILSSPLSPSTPSPPPTLDNLLSLPIKHMSRYTTLLSSLLEHTPSDHPDHPSILSSLQLLRHVADCLEDSKKGLLNAEKVASIAKNILDIPKETPLTSSPHRLILTEGILYHCDRFEEEVPIFVPPTQVSLRKSIIRAPLPFLGRVGGGEGDSFTGEMDPFYCFLFNDVLVITVDRSAYFGPKYKFVNFLGNYASLRVDPSPSVPPPLAEKADQFHFFELRFPRSSYMLAVKTEKEKEEWVNHLEGVVGEGFGKEMFGLGLGLGLGEGAGAEIQNDLLEGARCEGVLMKQSVYLKKWNERYCLIRGTTFFMAMKEGEAAYTKIDLERCSFKPGDDELSFKLIEKDLFHFAAKSKNDFRKWTHVLSAYGLGLMPQTLDTPFATRKAPRSEDLDIPNEMDRMGVLNRVERVDRSRGSSIGEKEEVGFDEHDLITVEFEIEGEEEEEEPAPAPPVQVAWIRELERNVN